MSPHGRKTDAVTSLLQLSKGFALFLILTTLTACSLATTRPKMEMSMAQTAFIAARNANAQTLAPGLYRKAEFYYLRAKSSYRRKYFNKAKQYAILSKEYSEKAEFVAVQKAPETF
jgi:hypothetical protein